MRASPPAHYIKHNKVTRIPRAFFYLDTEARRVPIDRGEMQVFRLAHVALDRRSHHHDSWAERETGDFHSTQELWAWIDARCSTRARSIVAAHNLAYDLRIGSAFTELPSLGWTLKRVAFNRGRAWCTWKRETRSLVMVDTMSWVPVGLERLGEMVEIPKLPLPDWDDSDEAWMARCQRDVQILAAVGRDLWDWVRADDLGNWKPTGAGQAWAAFRHRFMEHKLLAHDNERAREAERRSAWTGRCEVWTHGKPNGGPFSEWDFSAAHAHIGAECELPIKLLGTSSRASMKQWRKLVERHAVLAECEVTTETPTVPCLVDDRITWPVGTFTTTLWENEVQLALEHGARVTISRLWWYERANALAKFCEWILEYLNPRHRYLSPVVVLAAKHWGRALIGRFGSRYSEWETIGQAPNSDLSLTTVIDKSEGVSWELLQVGHECKRETSTQDSADAVVSIMAWVMAECRVRLWNVTQIAGAENVCYLDTDGLIVNREGTERLRAANVPGLRLKGEWATADFIAPRRIILSGALRAAGVPKRATRVAPDTWEADVWQELTTSLRNGTADRVDIATRRIRLSGADSRRDHHEGGRTAPRRVGAQT